MQQVCTVCIRAASQSMTMHLARSHCRSWRRSAPQASRRRRCRWRRTELSGGCCGSCCEDLHEPALLAPSCGPNDALQNLHSINDCIRAAATAQEIAQCMTAGTVLEVFGGCEGQLGACLEMSQLILNKEWAFCPFRQNTQALLASVKHVLSAMLMMLTL